jgi:predicted transcriptional regulator
MFKYVLDVRDVMNTPLDDIRFLADSANRVRAIEALAEGPRTRAELRDETDASAATVGRTLGAFEDRGWVARGGNRYALTSLGTYVASGFSDLHDRMRTADEYEALFPHLPLEEVNLDAEGLADVRVTVPTETNPMAIVTRIREVARRSTRHRSLSYHFSEPCVDAHHRAVLDGTQTYEIVVPWTALEAEMGPNCVAQLEELVSADRCSMYLYDGNIPYAWGVADGHVEFVVKDDRMVSAGMVETDDPVAVERFTETFEEYRERSTLLTPEDLERAKEREVVRT